MAIDPSIHFILIVPDGAPEQATPPQGFALCLCRMSWAIRRAALLPTNVFDLTDESRENLLARRMSGMYPVNWVGQSPRAIRFMPYPPFIPFSLIILPESESPADYKAWADSRPLRPTLVAKKNGDLRREKRRRATAGEMQTRDLWRDLAGLYWRPALRWRRHRAGVWRR